METELEPEVERFSCIELRGGNHHALYSAVMPGLEGWVSCRPLRPAAKGGDVYYLSVCNEGAISRVTLADVVGHGEVVSQAALRLRDALRQHSSSFDQSQLIRKLNDTFLNAAQTSLEYATAFVIGYYARTGEMLFTNAGHPPPLWYRAATKQWAFLEESVIQESDLPLGLIPGTTYTQTAATLEPGDTILLYTDGISEAVDRAGNQLGLRRLLEFARELPTTSPLKTGSTLLSAVKEYRGHSAATDDETLIVLRRPSV